jgi:hypothetical protein
MAKRWDILGESHFAIGGQGNMASTGLYDGMACPDQLLIMGLGKRLRDGVGG